MMRRPEFRPFSQAHHRSMRDPVPKLGSAVVARKVLRADLVKTLLSSLTRRNGQMDPLVAGCIGRVRDQLVLIAVQSLMDRIRPRQRIVAVWRCRIGRLTRHMLASRGRTVDCSVQLRRAKPACNSNRLPADLRPGLLQRSRNIGEPRHLVCARIECRGQLRMRARNEELRQPKMRS